MSTRSHVLATPLTVRLSGAAGTSEHRIERVDLREPTADDLLLVDRYALAPVRLRVEMIARLSDMTPAQVRKLAAADFHALSMIAMDGVVPPIDNPKDHR